MRWSSRSIWHFSTTAQAVISFRSPGLNPPRFVLRPEILFHRMGDVVGLHDIDFDSHPQFSKKYLLRGTADEKVRELFRHDVLDVFEDIERVSAEGLRDQFIYRSWKTGFGCFEYSTSERHGAHSSERQPIHQPEGWRRCA